MKRVAIIVVAVVACWAFVYGAFWAAKHGSYALLYEDMVIETVKEQVLTGCLESNYSEEANSDEF